MDFVLEVIIAVSNTYPFSCACRSAVCSAIWCLSSCQWGCTLWEHPWAISRHPAVPAPVSPGLPQCHCQHLVPVWHAAAALGLGCPSAPGLPEYVWPGLISSDLTRCDRIWSAGAWEGLNAKRSCFKQCKNQLLSQNYCVNSNQSYRGAAELRCVLSSAIFTSGSWLAPVPGTVPLACNNRAINSYLIYMQIFLVS